MVVIKPPFVNYTPDEDKKDDGGTVFSLRLNKEEYEKLKEAKDWFDTDQNSTAVKILVDVGYNVLQGQFSGGVLEWLFKKDRVRSSDLRGRK